MVVDIRDLVYPLLDGVGDLLVGIAGIHFGTCDLRA